MIFCGRNSTGFEFGRETRDNKEDFRVRGGMSGSCVG
jgi:hypothetical protein